MNKEIDRLLRLKEVLHITGRSRTSWYKQIQEGKAPAPAVSCHRFAAWKESDIKAYIEALCVQK
ncbi:MAG: AlpA family phage regulatory protein [Campylobacteraceae bacterium]|jgi:prophage regulatory protein|nr:AlpA family phage regulatory protein [Campylobacteraceae bacterium]